MWVLGMPTCGRRHRKLGIGRKTAVCHFGAMLNNEHSAIKNTCDSCDCEIGFSSVNEWQVRREVKQQVVLEYFLGLINVCEGKLMLSRLHFLSIQANVR
jgi:hypothetical protein